MLGSRKVEREQGVAFLELWEGNLLYSEKRLVKSAVIGIMESMAEPPH